MYYIYTKDGIREVTEKEYYEKPTYFEFCRISNFHVSLFFIGILDPRFEIGYKYKSRFRVLHTVKDYKAAQNIFDSYVSRVRKKYSEFENE